MKERITEVGGHRVVVAVFEPEDEATGSLTAAIRRLDVGAAQVTGIGGFRSAKLGYFEHERRDYREIPVDEQVEVLSLLGDVALNPEGRPVAHLHAVLGKRDGSTVGGHLLAGTVWPTLELILEEVPTQLAKRWQPELGLALIDPGRQPARSGA